MLEAVLNHLHNWFPVHGAARTGAHEIVSGELMADYLKPGQYFRIEGSVFNDGLHRWPCSEVDCLVDEAFDGTVTPLAVPKAVIELAEKIGEYCEKNPATDKVSESFGGYSYSRGTDGNGAASGGWTLAFRKELNCWKKVG